MINWFGSMNFSSKLFDRSFVEWNSKILDEDKEGEL